MRGLLQGRRDKVYFGYSWHTREPRYPEWRNARALVAGLEAGLREAESRFRRYLADFAAGGRY